MTDKQDFAVDVPNFEVRDRADRLRQAIRAAGGNRAVSARSRVPVGTLGYYIAGRDMKASALISLAAACNVSLEWLATGREPMAPAAAPGAPNEPQRGAFATIDVHRFADALEVSAAVIRAKNTDPDWLRLAQIILLMYDELEPEP